MMLSSIGEQLFVLTMFFGKSLHSLYTKHENIPKQDPHFKLMKIIQRKLRRELTQIQGLFHPGSLPSRPPIAIYPMPI